MRLTNFTEKKLPLKDLKPYSLNPRKQTAKGANSLKTSLEKYGQVRPFVLNYDLTIIGGNQMYDILFKEHGATYMVDCYVSDKQLEESQVKELNILLNKDAGAWDYEMLKKYNDENLLNTHFEAWELGNFTPHFESMQGVGEGEGEESESEIDLNSFFEPDTSEPKEEKFKIILEYNKSDCNLVLSKLKEVNSSKEKAVKQLLGI